MVSQLSPGNLKRALATATAIRRATEGLDMGMVNTDLLGSIGALDPTLLLAEKTVVAAEMTPMRIPVMALSSSTRELGRAQTLSAASTKDSEGSGEEEPDLQAGVEPPPGLEKPCDRRVRSENSFAGQVSEEASAEVGDEFTPVMVDIPPGLDARHPDAIGEAKATSLPFCPSDLPFVQIDASTFFSCAKFCAQCGMAVAPKLYKAKYCAFCGAEKVHARVSQQQTAKAGEGKCGPWGTPYSDMGAWSGGGVTCQSEFNAFHNSAWQGCEDSSIGILGGEPWATSSNYVDQVLWQASEIIAAQERLMASTEEEEQGRKSEVRAATRKLGQPQQKCQ